MASGISIEGCVMARTVVVMPAKDAESTVGQAVKSTLRAMPKDAQLLVVNDGSVDNTGSVLDEIRDRR
ncbi:glycosyltransferase, partial [Streptomyces sp. GbtcB7]|uniref:glycosyltransferase n=1 Tax=Streptomyces sp. GbtcB7 TaxID=2824752 RepID=UPI001C2F1E2A